MSGVLDAVRNIIRNRMRAIARGVNQLSGGKITPNMVTITSLIAHIPITYAIATDKLLLSAILLVIFGLMDALDGELARLQGKASAAGMLLDASTDRMKEVLIYIGVAFTLSVNGSSIFATEYLVSFVVAACGGSLLVSYVKAKGETAVRDSTLTANEINRLFQDGLMRYEIRMMVIIIGLVFNALDITILLIAILAWQTALKRLFTIHRRLS